MSMDPILNYLDKNRDRHVEQLCDWLRIPSISSVSEHNEDTKRAAVFVADELRELVTRGASTVQLREKAVEQGMCLLREDGLRAMFAGGTTIEELLKFT